MAINVPLNAQLQNATQLQQQVQNAVNAVRINLGGPNGARALSSLSQPLGRLTGQADEFTKSLDAANARVLAFGASVGVVNALSNAFKALVVSTIEVEKAITEISVVGDQFTGKNKELSQGLFNIAKNTGQAFNEVSKAALEFSRQGLSLEDTLARTQDALVLTRTTGLEASKSVDGLTAAVNAFAKAGLSTTQVLNKLAAVDQAFAVSSADLIEAFQRTGAVAQQAGVSFDELAGIVTALQTETSRGGAVIGNALKTIFSRLQDTSTLTQLQDLGVAVQDLQGNVLPARQILQNLAGDLQGLSKITQAGIFKEVAGTFQLNQLVSLVNDLNKAQSISAAATAKSAGATNEAYIANEKLNQSLDAILNKVATTGKQLGSLLGEIGLSDNLKGLLDGINSFLESVNNVLQGDDIGSKFAKGFVKGIGSVLSGPGLGVFLAIITKLSFDLLKFGAQSLKTFFGIGKAANDQKQIQESIVQTLLKNQNVLNSILSTQGGQNAQGLKFLSILNQQAAAMQAIQGLAGNIAGTVYGAGYRQTPQGLARRSASGYLPAQEASDVRRGVGGASPSSKVVAIPNFAFGGGKRGTMIANTSEYIVPNYASGGSAIFNQDMVKTMGLPAGAKKISAAGGFVPNFANEARQKQIKDVSDRYALITNDIQDGPVKVRANPKNDRSISYELFSYGIPSLTTLKNNTKFKDSRFTNQALIEKYKKLALDEASDYSLAIGGRNLGPYEREKLSNPGVVAGLVGAIFESGITGVINGDGLRKAQSEQASNARFDFVNQPDVKGFFGINNPNIKYIEAKYSKSPDALKSLGNKILNIESGTAVIEDKKPIKASGPTSKIRNESDVFRALNSTSAKKGSFNFVIPDAFEKKISAESIQKLISAGGIRVRASTGYIPNFAVSALQEAIAREKSAGLSSSQIYVDQNSSLRSPQNPMGLMVANTRDEPFGGIQGISRARKEGMNPKLYGAANGFVPNYAKGGVAKKFDEELQKLVEAVKTGAKTQAEANKALKTFVNSLQNTQTKQPISKRTQEKYLKAGEEAIASAKDSEKASKGFGDMAGKIFLIQSALSFMNGAVGEATTSFGKLTQQTITTIGNISSLAFFGKEISQLNPAGALGKFAKGLGIAGVAVAGAIEGFKLIDFAIKEFSGENERAALATAKLADASDKLSVKFESLSKTRQTELLQQASETLGSKGYQGFLTAVTNLFRQNKVGGGDIGGDPEIQKALALLYSLGASAEEIDNIFDKIKQERTTEYTRFNRKGETYSVGVQEDIRASDVKKRLSQELFSGLGKTLDTQFKSFQAALGGFNVSTPEGKINAYAKASQIYGASFEELPKEKQRLIEEEIKRQEEVEKLKKGEIELERDIALGQKISIELAKQKLDALLEQKKAQIDLKASLGKEGLRLQLETLDVSESYRNELEKQIKLKEIDAELSKKNLDIVSSAIDKLTSLPSDAKLGVSANQFNAIAGALGGENIQSASDLEKAINKIGEQLGLAPAQLEGVNALFENQFQTAKNIADAQKKSAENAAAFNSKVIDTKNSLQATQLITEKIVADLERASRVRLSAEGVGFNQKENAIKLLRERASATTNSSEAKSLNAQAIAQEIELNKAREESSTSQFQGKRKQLKQQLDAAQKEYLRLSRQNVMSGFQIDPKVLQTASEAYKNLEVSLKELNNEEAIANQNFANTNQTLDLQAKAIYRVIGAADALQNSLDQFRLGAGERVGNYQLEALGATDINSLAKAGIKTDVEANASGIKDNAEYYKVIQEQTRLREIQFDLATAESEVRRRELQYELKYTQELIDLKNKGATEQELIDARNRQISEQRSGARGFERGLDTIQDRINNYRSTLGEEIPNLFSQNLAQGLNDAISGAKTLKEALTDAATSFFQEITRRNISNLADLVTGGLGKGASAGASAGGGIISSIFGFFGGGNKTVGRASGGLIKGGSGNKDDVPAMLMGGEYVVKKSAVNKYGKGFLDAINSGSIRGYATGGMVDPQTFPTQTGRGGFFTPGDYGQGAITGKNELLTFASQSFTSGQYDYMGGFGMGGATVSLEPESARLSALGREGSPMFERVQQSKDEAFRVYLEGLQKEKEYAELLDQIAKEKKARKKALQTAIISAVISGAASYAGTAMKVGAANASAAGGSKLAGAFAGSGGQGGVFNIARGTGTTLSSSAKALEFAKIAPIIQSGGYTNPLLPLPNWTSKPLPNQRATGGLISGGSNIRDDVPAMLTGGEFVLNNRATQRIGLQNLNKLNSGASVSSEGSSTEMTQALISKLDELIQTTAESSKDNVVVNVSTNEAGNQETQNPAGAEKELQRKIREAVLNVIAQEKRLGGSLEKAK